MADVGESKLRQRMRPKPATPSKCGRKRQRIIQGDAIQDPIHPTNDAFEQASLPLTPSGADQRTTRAVPRPILVAETQVRLPKDVAGSAWAANVYYAHFLRVEESAEEVHGGVARRRQGNHRAAKQGEAVSAAMKEDQWNRVALREHRPGEKTRS